MTVIYPESCPSSEWSEFILRNLPVALLTVDAELSITYFNPLAEKLTGYTAAEAQGRGCHEILRGAHCDGSCPLRTVLNAEKEALTVDTSILTKDGRTLPIRLLTAAMFDRDGRLMGAVEAFSDSTQIRLLEDERARTLSLFAHDMKSPLTVIEGLVARLLAGRVGELSDAQNDYLRRVREQVHQVQSLVLDFLDVARLGKDSPELATAPTDMADLLRSLGSDFLEMAREAGMDLEVNIPERLPEMQADAHRLRRMFGNLLENAVKYAGRGTVRLEAKEDGQRRIVVEVSDEGPGLTEHDLANLFQPFHRGEAGRNKEGTGLGLAAVKSIAEAHHGSIAGGNLTRGGARFTVVLPVS